MNIAVLGDDYADDHPRNWNRLEMPSFWHFSWIRTWPANHAYHLQNDPSSVRSCSIMCNRFDVRLNYMFTLVTCHLLNSYIRDHTGYCTLLSSHLTCKWEVFICPLQRQISHCRWGLQGGISLIISLHYEACTQTNVMMTYASIQTTEAITEMVQWFKDV